MTYQQFFEEKDMRDKVIQDLNTMSVDEFDDYYGIDSTALKNTYQRIEAAYNNLVSSL